MRNASRALQMWTFLAYCLNPKISCINGFSVGNRGGASWRAREIRRKDIDSVERRRVYIADAPWSDITVFFSGGSYSQRVDKRTCSTKCVLYRLRGAGRAFCMAAPRNEPRHIESTGNVGSRLARRRHSTLLRFVIRDGVFSSRESWMMSQAGFMTCRRILEAIRSKVGAGSHHFHFPNPRLIEG